MNKFIDFALDHYKAAISFLVFVIVMGIIAYVRIPKELFPDIEVPFIQVNVTCQGISTYDSERLIVRPMEQKLRSISGVKEMNTVAYEGGASAVLEFFPEKNLRQAKTEVQDQVDLVKAELPEDAKDPVVTEINISETPILLIKLAGNIPDRKLYKIAEDLQDDIEAQVYSVLRVDVIGSRSEIIEVLLDPAKIGNYQLSMQDISSLFKSNNKLVSAGSILNNVGAFSVKVPGVLSNLQEIMECPLASNGQSSVSVADIATIRRTYEDPTGFARDRGKKAIVLEVVKRSGENLIETISNVRKVVAESEKKWGAGDVSVSFAYDQSKMVMDNLHELENTIFLAIILVVLIIAYSLGKKTAVLVSVSIPGAFLAGILYIYLCGYTLNMIVLFSLIFAVGMLVDGAIIVVEYADRKIEEGFRVRDAYRLAAQRMAWPVITSISTILAVFFPLLFWPDMIGKVMKFLPITLIATLTSSIFMALIFVPCLAIVCLRDKNAATPSYNPQERYDLPSSGFGHAYVRLLDWALHRPFKVLGSVALLLIVSIWSFAKFGAGIEFFPSMEPNTAVIKILARGNLSIYEKDKLIREVENLVIPFKELSSVYSRVGDSKTANPMAALRDGAKTEDEIGRIMIEFVDWQERRKAQQILDDIERKLKPIAGIQVIVEPERKGPPNTPVDVCLIGNDYDRLHRELKKIRDYLITLEELQSVQDTLPVSNIEWRLVIDRSRAINFNASVATIGNVVQLVTRGLKIGVFRPDDSKNEIDIMVKFPPEYRNIDELKNLDLQTSAGSVPISNFISYSPGHGVSKLSKLDGLFCARAKAQLKPGCVSGVVIDKIKQWIGNNIPKDVNVAYKGAQQDQQKAGSFLGFAFLVAICSIAIMMIIQFNSFFSTFVVLSAVLLSTIGVFVGLLIRGMPFGVVMGGIGVIALAGIIVSNNIILIDTYSHLSDKISDVKMRILVTGAQRLRPVFLTKVTAILSLLPVMFAINIDLIHGQVLFGAPTSDMWVQLSGNIVCGLTFGSILTLIVTPCALMVRGVLSARRTANRQA
ncbi:MAG: efflux RND transporter permease subunit [Holosporales bacterium]|jgi:multidrug efflux pump|nr:efflux RND transporter permease subunit [Holosporales bacterium]